MADFQLNDVDMSTRGLAATQAPELLSSPKLSYARIARVGRAGAVVSYRQIEVKAFQVAGILESTSLAAARSNMDAIYADARIGQPSTVIFGWSTSRRLVTECLGVQVSPLGSLFGIWKYDVRFMFEAPDPPFWQATTQKSVTTVKSTGKTLAMGNAPVYAQVAVTNAAAGFTVRLKNSTGTQVAEMAFSSGPTSTEYWLIDMDAGTVRQQASILFGATSGASQIAALTSGDFFAVQPEHFDANASSWATLEIYTGAASAGSGTAYWYDTWF